VLTAVLAYGFFRLGERPGDDAKKLKVALVQSSFDTVFDGNRQRDIDTFHRALEQTLVTRREHPDLDLVVWPESAYTGDLPDVTVQGKPRAPADADLSDAQFGAALKNWSHSVRRKARDVAEQTNRPASKETQRAEIHLIVGTGGQHFSSSDQGIYNTALWITPEGEIAGRYHKMHPVMFGEYVPLGDIFPSLYNLMPMSGGLTPGPGPSAFEIDEMVVAPSICFESVVPHLIRGQCNELAGRGKDPDFLVNVTNDGWFHGSSILDIHLTCGVFRAIENRTPLLISANTGPTAIVDSSGEVVEVAPRRKETVVVGTVATDGRRAPYRIIGDWPAGACLLLSGAMAVFGLATRWKRKQAL
jgi:apolipoprotein N-acyltransferase